MKLRAPLEVIPFMSGKIPCPPGYCAACGCADGEWNEVCCQTELVRALPWPRFTNSTGSQVCLPLWATERLEGFEENLRQSGLIVEGQVLCQSNYSPFKFTVQSFEAICSDRHRSYPFGLTNEPVFFRRGRRVSAEFVAKEDQKRLRAAAQLSRAKSGASLDN